MKRPSKNDIKAALDKMKATGQKQEIKANEHADAPKPAAKQSSQRIRKKGV